MTKRILILSLLISLLFFTFFMVTGNGVVLAPVLLSLLISFICAMFLLSKK